MSSGSLDRASHICLEEYAIQCRDVVDACSEFEYDPAKGSEQEHTFFTFAPGLLDLVSGMVDDDEELLDFKAIQTRVRGAVTAAGSARSVLTGMDSGKAAGAMRDCTNAGAAAVAEGAPKGGRAVRGAKAQASEKIRSQMRGADDDGDELENEAP